MSKHFLLRLLKETTFFLVVIFHLFQTKFYCLLLSPEKYFLLKPNNDLAEVDTLLQMVF